MMVTNRNHALDGMRILAVEDQEDLREVLTALLEQQGAIVIGCRTAGEAFAILISGAPLDAAVFDISMPDEDGLALVGRLRQWESSRAPGHLPVIALTALVSGEIQQECRAAGFDHYLPKPVSPRILFNTLRRLAPLH